ncbi:MAG TPA: quinol dehydrogenase ferredoxin subunit NapH [Leucothrix sp.]|nr:quinol dehydrogenase ferredoxin subunit NapH [Leucothrix sp.]
MRRKMPLGVEAVLAKGWFGAHRLLLLRRLTQVSILALFMISPWLANKIDLWIIKGNLSSSLTLELIPLTDPFVFIQTLAAGHWPIAEGVIGVIIVSLFYFLVGGRVYCSWVCPINIVTDTAAWLRDKLNIKGGLVISARSRFWVLIFTLIISVVTGKLAWEMINPVSIVFRGLIFGMGLAWGMILAIFLLDLIVSRRAWCSHLCPVGAFYSLLGKFSLVRVNAYQREKCDDCMDCFIVCPEKQVIKGPLKGADKNISSFILSDQCTNCGRCIDICAEDVFKYDLRLKK